MENLKKNQQISNTWIKKFFDYLKVILDKYISRFGDYVKLDSFMKDDKNLYKKDGSPTKEYKEWIQKFEEHVSKDNHIVDIIISENPEDKDRLEFLEGVKEYLAQRKEISKTYEKAQSCDAWLNNVYGADEEKKKAFETLIDKEMEESLKNMTSDNE